MIQELFLPDVIGNYYFITKKVAAIDIKKTNISACVISLSGNKRTIEKIINIPIEPGPANTAKERIIATLTHVKEQLGNYTELVSILPGNIAITKELKLPFADREKISLVIGFEMEPLLPFPKQDTIIDFLITKRVEADHSAEMIAAAVQKSTVEDHLSLYQAVNMNPTKVILDTFVLYGLYKTVPSYQESDSNVILLDISLNNTQISYLINNQLKAIRSLPHGVLYITKGISTLLNQNNMQAIDTIMRYGLETTQPPDQIQAIKQAIDGLWKEIVFTIDILSYKNPHNKVNTLIVTGMGTQIPGFVQYLSTISNTECKSFAVNEFLENSGIADIPAQIDDIVVIGAALPMKEEYDCNFSINKNIIHPYRFITQITSPLILSLISLLFLITFTQIQLNTLSQEVSENEKEAILELKNIFPQLSENTDENIDEIITEAERLVTKEENTWYVFSPASRTSCLECLLELTANIDKEALGFEPKSIAINEKTVTIQASVKSYDALRALEQSLKHSKLFKKVEGQQVYTNFVMKITLNPQVR